MKMTKTEIRNQLERICGPAAVSADEEMKRHTSFRAGGPADYFVQAGDAETLRQALIFLKNEDIPCFIMGNGSNLLVSDEGFRGAVIRLGKNMEQISVNGTEIRAEAGALLSAVAQCARRASLGGMEFAAGIPGSVGGACVMNAGAYGGEMKQILTRVRVLDEAFEDRWIPAEDLELGYRTSIFSRKPYIALEASMELREGREEEIAAVMEDLKKRRQDKQPLDLPSAGSTFKRPEGHFAGKLIMDAGLKGFRVGGASVSEKHCGFVVNDRGATASQIRSLIREVQRIVFETSGVMLEPEVRFLGNFEGSE